MIVTSSYKIWFHKHVDNCLKIIRYFLHGATRGRWEWCYLLGKDWFFSFEVSSKFDCMSYLPFQENVYPVSYLHATSVFNVVLNLQIMIWGSGTISHLSQKNISQSQETVVCIEQHFCRPKDLLLQQVGEQHLFPIVFLPYLRTETIKEREGRERAGKNPLSLVQMKICHMYFWEERKETKNKKLRLFFQMGEFNKEDGDSRCNCLQWVICNWHILLTLMKVILFQLLR